MSIGGTCQIVGRPVGVDASRKCDFTNRPDGADVICAAPDDLHYEIEPMLEMEAEIDAEKM